MKNKKLTYILFQAVIFIFLSNYTGWARCIKGNCSNGYSVYTWSNGDTFEGIFKDGKQNGQGTLTWADGNKYAGEFKDGIQHGQGTFIWANGNMYVGDFADGIQHGQGTFTWVNGNKYTGEFKQGKQHGQGTLEWANGNKYTGEFKEENQHGQGTFTWANGNTYTGNFEDGKQHGQGTFTWTNGDKYVGEFKDGNQHGQGTFIWADGNKYIGEFKDGDQHGQGTFTWIDGNKYIGEFKNGKQSGQGTFTWADGSRYDGEFKDGKQAGQGTMYYASGIKTRGIWTEDKFIASSTEFVKPNSESAPLISQIDQKGKTLQPQEIIPDKSEKIIQTKDNSPQPLQIPTIVEKTVQTVSAPAPEPLAIAPPPQNLTETVKLVSEIKKQRRTAIVIGNANYKKAPLKNPLNDAQDIAKILQETGFSVILKLDVSQEQMEDSIREFGRQLIQGGIGLFYYAGHGVQVDGKNYLIPIGADIAIKNQKDVRYKAVDLNQILDEMNYAGNGFNIAILDACRDNPLPRSFRSTAASGLARVDGPKGTLITFATSPGSVAIDGEGRNGVFTKHLLENMKIPGLPIEQIFKRVLQGVDQESNGEQTPWMSSSFTGDFYFIP